MTESKKVRVDYLVSRKDGTAVGTGINAHPDFAEKFVKNISKKQVLILGFPSYFEAISSQDSSLELSSHLRSLATCLIKISNDLRWMNFNTANAR